MKDDQVWCYLWQVHEASEAQEFHQQSGDFVTPSNELAEVDVEKPEKGQGQVGVSCIDKVLTPCCKPSSFLMRGT